MTTQTTSHTPGPWAIRHETTISAPSPFDGSGSWDVARIIPWSGDLADQWHANAQLIAAAPELLEALLAMSALLPSNEGLGGHAPMSAFLSMAPKIRSAIARATGGNS